MEKINKDFKKVKMKVIKSLKKNIKEETKKQNKKFKRVYLEVEKTDIYFMQVDVPINENNSLENTNAIKIAWEVINSKEYDSEKMRIGDRFGHKILKKEIIEYTKKDN